MTIRNKVFISHATPGDNGFAVWLSSRLSMAGYDVWCDVNKLLGGEDFWQEIEFTIRNQAAKFLIVISRNAYSGENLLRNGIAKELALAEVVKKNIGDQNFIVPVRIDSTNYGDFSIELLRINGVDCSLNWAAGLSRIIQVFERDGVPRKHLASESLSAWRAIHQHHTSAITEKSELLQSNWLPITSMPETLYFFQPPGIQWAADARMIAKQASVPMFAHGRFLASFANLTEAQQAVGAHFALREHARIPVKSYLHDGGGNTLAVQPYDARNQVSSLVRQAWDSHMRSLGLREYTLANGQIAWWFPRNLPQDGQLRFTDFNGKQRWRTPSGIKGQKTLTSGESVVQNYWHLGFTAHPSIGDQSVMRLRSRIVITSDGTTPIANKTRLNGIRRSLTKLWFNDKWRGLLLGFSNFASTSDGTIMLPVSASNNIVIGSRPLTFLLNHGIASDPVDENLSDELADADDKLEISRRLSDPVFAALVDDKEPADE